MTDDMKRASVPFGKALRAKRLEKKFTLRKFAELVGVSPTYLSQVEQCNVVPPTADRVKRIAELLGENPDEWAGLAGRVPDDLSEIIQEAPTHISGLLRAVQGMTAEQLRKLRKAADRIRSNRNSYERLGRVRPVPTLLVERNLFRFSAGTTASVAATE